MAPVIMKIETQTVSLAFEHLMNSIQTTCHVLIIFFHYVINSVQYTESLMRSFFSDDNDLIIIATNNLYKNSMLYKRTLKYDQ
jgi:hypothetical protein